MSQIWLTTQWPKTKVDPHPWNIYVQKGQCHVGSNIAPGDRILIYEFRSGKRRVDGPPLRKGRGGIVAIAVTKTSLQERTSAPAVEHYTDGTIKNWAWEAWTQDLDFDGFVVRENVIRVLGYSDAYTMRGFGGGSGLKKISESQFEELFRLFKQGALPGRG